MKRLALLAAALTAFSAPALADTGDLDRLRQAVAASYAGARPIFNRPPAARPVNRRAAVPGKSGRLPCPAGLAPSAAGCRAELYASNEQAYPGQSDRAKIFSLLQAVPIGSDGQIGLGMDLPRLMNRLQPAYRGLGLNEEPRFGPNHRR